MTEENYKYRTSQSLLRNQFPGQGKLKIPMIPKFQIQPGDFDALLLIGFDKTHLEDQKHLSRMLHFFSMITALNGYGKVRKMTLKSYPATGRYYLRTLACIWRWHL